MCPQCHAVFGAAEVAQAESDAARDRNRIQVGRAILIFLLGSLVALHVAAFVVHGAMGTISIGSVLRFGAELTLYYLLYVGVRWARAVTAILLALGAVFLTFDAVVLASMGAVVAVAIVASAIVLSGLGAVALIASPSVRWFLLHQERERHGER